MWGCGSGEGVWLRRGGVEEPEVALGVTRTLLTYPVVLDGWLFDDLCSGCDRVGVVRVQVVHDDNGHAGRHAQVRRGPVVVG